MKLYGLKNCDTCRKAAKVLGVEVTDARATPLTHDELSTFRDAFGDALLNTRSTTWRGLSAAEQGGDMIDLLIQHPALMKRPVISASGTLYLGWKKDVQEALGA